jgi:hypothetical protein
MKELINRLTETWTPQCWFGFFVEALPESDDYPAHFLVACWQPQHTPPIAQLPHAAAIVSKTSVNAAAELLRLIPAGVPIILLTRDFVNAALIADMILISDRYLPEHCRQGLEAFIAEDRKQWRVKIESRFSDVDDSFEKFKLKLFDADKI